MTNQNKNNRCSLTPDAFSERAAWINAAVFSRALGQTAIQNGTEIEFPSDEETFQVVVDFIKGERLCCDFFAFELLVSARQGPIILRVKENKPG